ncbi:hypothetical protein Cch01nite_41460 [Cellulomonas chitinilytica]|uniref:DUF1269 domain-containing protein n=1 Tax=Cellulomonas chitinilytica TaxID=398759 RepID=A0A919U4G4_9CELL|nr:DUF6325 family protein [Cellulomonas chitinilytica]GIG23422.1 hypothetical protein Cch01nite_41460 [Cellulomonas chitinilytica]
MPAQPVEVTVLGTLPARSVLRLRAHGVRDAHRQTVVHGTVRDTAALLGLVEQAHALGLDVVGVRRTTPVGRRTDGMGVALVVAGGVGDVLLSMLDHLQDRQRLRCTALTVRQDAFDEVLAWLRAHSVAVLTTAAPLPPVTGDASDDAAGDAEEATGRAARATARTSAVPADEEDDVTDQDDSRDLGPIDYLVVEFPHNKLDGTAFPLLIDLVDRGIIRILDLVFVEKQDGTVRALQMHEAAEGGGETDLSIFEGAASGLLGDDDVAEAAAALEDGSAAAILVYENAWAGPFAAALRRGGGQLVATGRIPVQSILAALDDLDES